jgi:hypothetical protein
MNPVAAHQTFRADRRSPHAAVQCARGFALPATSCGPYRAAVSRLRGRS